LIRMEQQRSDVIAATTPKLLPLRKINVS